MRYQIERNQGPAGFERILESREVDSESSAIDVLRPHVITPFNPDHLGEPLKFEAIRPTLAIASLPADTEGYADNWICVAMIPDEGFDL